MKAECYQTIGYLGQVLALPLGSQVTLCQPLNLSESPFLFYKTGKRGLQTTRLTDVLGEHLARRSSSEDGGGIIIGAVSFLVLQELTLPLQGRGLNSPGGPGPWG